MEEELQYLSQVTRKLLDSRGKNGTQYSLDLQLNFALLVSEVLLREIICLNNDCIY